MGLFNDINVQVNGSNDILSSLQSYSTKILRPNIVDGKNILLQRMVESENTKYIIKWDYDLHAQTITIPNNCILEFDGGSFTNGTLIGNDTYVSSHQNSQDVLKNLVIEGNFIYKNPSFKIMTEEEYDSLDDYSEDTIYFVTEN